MIVEHYCSGQCLLLHFNASVSGSSLELVITFENYRTEALLGSRGGANAKITGTQSPPHGSCSLKFCPPPLNILALKFYPPPNCTAPVVNNDRSLPNSTQ